MSKQPSLQGENNFETMNYTPVKSMRSQHCQKRNLERIETKLTLLVHLNEPMKMKNIQSSR